MRIKSFYHSGQAYMSVFFWGDIFGVSVEVRPPTLTGPQRGVLRGDLFLLVAADDGPEMRDPASSAGRH